MDTRLWVGLILLITITNIFQNVRSSGVMEIRFHRFQFRYIDSQDQSLTDPPASNSTNDSPWFSEVPCPGPPSYRFILCLDSLEHSNTSNECSLGRVDTGLVPVDEGSAISAGMDTIFFGSTFQTPPNVVPNPLPFNFPEWPGGIRIKVYISCCPSIPRLQDQCQEEVIYNFTNEPGKDRWSTLPEDVTLHQRNRLWLQVNLFCDASYYDNNCSTHCEIQDPTEHFMCNHLTGEKECTHGWQGVDCKEDIDECVQGVCQNEAECKNVPGEYECICQPGFTGLFCQYRVPGCPSNPCQNGGSCVDTDSGYVCFCEDPYVGTNCEMMMTTQPTQDVQPVTTLDSVLLPEYNNIGHTEVPEPAAKTDGKEVPSSNWYIIVIAIVLTVIVASLLIALVIWTSKRKKYKISKALKRTSSGEVVPETPPREQAFDNNVYLSTNSETFGRSIPFGNGIFSNIGFDVPTQDGNSPYATAKKKKKPTKTAKSSKGASGSSAAGNSGAASNDKGAGKAEKGKDSDDKRLSKGTSEPRENLYVPWEPSLARTNKEYANTQMTEIDLSSQCDETELAAEPVRCREPVSSQLSSHYAVSRPISELREDMMSANPTGSLYSANRFKNMASTESLQMSPPSSGKRKTSVSSLVGGIVKWSPRTRKVSPDSEVDIGDLEMFNTKRRERKISNMTNIGDPDPDPTTDTLSPGEPQYNMSRRRSSYNLLEMSPNHSRFQRSEDIISLSSNSSDEGNMVTQPKQHPKICESGSEELDTSQYISMSGNGVSKKQSELEVPDERKTSAHSNKSLLSVVGDRRTSASTIGMSVNTSPVVSDSEEVDEFGEPPPREKSHSTDCSEDGFIVMKIPT